MNIQLSDHFDYKRLIKFVIPSVIMMVFTSIYSVVDGLFVSNFVGDTAFAAINLIMPAANLMGGVGFMLGTGGSALVAKTMGEQKAELANRYFTMIVKTTVIIGAILSVTALVFVRKISVLLGATEAMLPYCVTYGTFLSLSTLAFMLQYLFSSFLITAERPKLGLITTIAAGCTNMILDALFVAVMGWGVMGAAIATGLSQVVGFVIPLIFFLRPNDTPLQLVKTRMEIKPILKACGNGSSEMVSNITASFVGILYNFQLLKYAGQNGVSAYGVLMYAQFIFVAIFIGYSIGSAPIISYHFGAQNHDELKNLLRKSNVLMFTSGAAMVLAAELLVGPLSRLFVGYNEELFKMTVHAFRISTTAFIVVGFNIFASSFFTALNDGAVSAAISFLRTFIFKTAAVLALPMIFGLDGIWYSEVTAEIFAFLISLTLLFAKNKKYHYM